MGGDSNPGCLAAYTLSRRAQSTTLPPIPAWNLFVLVLLLVLVLEKKQSRTRTSLRRYNCRRRNSSSSGS